MPPADPTTDDAPWITRAGAALEHYAEPLLRAVAGRLIRPRNQWPPEELRERIAAALEDAVILDRTLRTLSPASRRLLKLIGLSRQWSAPTKRAPLCSPPRGNRSLASSSRPYPCR